METAELEKLVVTLAAEFGRDSFPYSRSLLDAATMELFIRNGDAALRWAEGLEGKVGRRVLFSMIQGVSKLSPMMARTWIDAYHKKFGKGGRGNEFLASLLTGAAGRSAEDYLAVLDAFPKEYPDGFVDNSAFPDDFDFMQLFDPECRIHRPDYLLPYLAAKDREAAWRLVEVGLGEGHKYHRAQFLGFAMHGVAEMEGEAAALGWALEKIDGLPAEQRQRVIECLDDHHHLSAAGMKQLVGWMRSDDERAAFIGDFVRPGALPEKSLEMLAYLPKERQTDLLIRNAAGWSWNMRDPESETTKAYQRYFDEMAEKVGLNPEEKERMNKALARARQ